MANVLLKRGGLGSVLCVLSVIEWKKQEKLKKECLQL